MGDPMNALHDAIVFNSRDFATTKFEAWIYGIVVGWDDEDDDGDERDATGEGSAMNSVAAKVGWTEQNVAHLRRLRAGWKRLEAAAPALLEGSASRCRATTVDPTDAGRPSCVWCVLPAGHQGMHRAELPQEHGPATLEWPSEVTE